MPSWSETARELTEPIPEMADSLKTELQELSDIKCVHFEALTKRMGPKGNQPKSVDCMGTSKKRTYLIEFKPLPSEGGEEIPRSLALKAMESLAVYRRFLSHEYGNREVGLMVVTQNPRTEIMGACTPKASASMMRDLHRYCKRDANGDVMFFDTVEMLGCKEFVRIAGKRFRHEDCPA